MTTTQPADLVALDVEHPVWDRFFTVAPLVVIGTREESGGYDLAPKHLAGALSWENHFGFICTPRHGTYQNVKREEEFAVSFPRPDQIVLASLAAAPRCGDGSKQAAVEALPTFAALEVDCLLLEDADLFLECRLERIVDGFGDNSLIAGRVVAARLRPQVLRDPDRDDQDLIRHSPLLAYLDPGRFARIEESFSFPFPAGFRR